MVHVQLSCKRSVDHTSCTDVPYRNLCSAWCCFAGGFQLFRDSAPFKTAAPTDTVNNFVPPTLNASSQTNTVKGTTLVLTFYGIPTAPGKSRVITAFFTNAKVPAFAAKLAAAVEWVFHLVRLGGGCSMQPKRCCCCCRHRVSVLPAVAMKSLEPGLQCHPTLAGLLLLAWTVRNLVSVTLAVACRCCLQGQNQVLDSDGMLLHVQVSGL